MAGRLSSRTASRFGFLITDVSGKRFPRPKTDGPAAREPAEGKTLDLSTVEHLSRAAATEDIGEHVAALGKALSDPMKQGSAAEALMWGAEKGTTDISAAIADMNETLLADEDEQLIQGVICRTLHHAVRGGTDISVAIPGLAAFVQRELDDPDQDNEYRKLSLVHAVKALRSAADKGMVKIDDQEVRSALQGAKDRENIAEDAGAALDLIDPKGGKAKGTTESAGEESKRRGAAMKLLAVAEEKDISAAVPEIVKTLETEDDEYIVSYLCQTLELIARTGDISLAVPVLGRILREAAEDLDRYGSCALNSAVKASVRALTNAGSDAIVDAVPDIETFLKSGNSQKLATEEELVGLAGLVPKSPDGVTTLFDALTVKRWDKVDLTDSCTVVCESVGTDRMNLQIMHKKSDCQQKIVVGFHEEQEDDWKRARVTDDGLLIWLRGRDGKIEAKAGPMTEEELPDFEVGDIEGGKQIGNTLWKYKDEKAERRIPVGGKYFLNKETGGHVTTSGRDEGIKSVTINFSLEIASSESWHTPYRREFSLSGFGSGKSFIIDGAITHVVLTEDGIRVRTSEVEP